MSRLLARVRASKLSHALAALLAAIAAIGITVAVSDQGVIVHIGKTHTGPTETLSIPATPPAVIAVDGADKNAVADNPVALTAKARDVATTLAAGAQSGTNDLVPKENGKPPLSGPIVGPIAKLQPPFAADSVPGCRTRFITTNWSARSVAQSQVVLFWLHYTAGPDIPNSRADVDGLTAFANNPASRVSWHLNMDKDGNCDYNVPFRYKAWTEAGANSTGIGIEVAGRGDAPYLRPGGYRELARIFIAIHAAYPAIQLRLGGVSNCSPTRGGIVTHWMGGPCSGGHIDIHPLDLVQVIATLRSYVAALHPVKITATDQERCARVHRFRTHPNRPGNSRTAFERRLKTTQVRGLKCVDGKAQHA